MSGAVAGDVRRVPIADDLMRVADALAGDDAVEIVGGGTHADIGGPVVGAVRSVSAPTGIITIDPAEMIVRVRAGTTVAELSTALAAAGQFVAVPSVNERTTIGGAVAVGWSSMTRLGHGPLRDSLLEATVVLADGSVVRAGGPVVKNVTGYDLHKVLVGSLGRLGLIVEVVLRTRPLPLSSSWFVGTVDPTEVLRTLWRPVAVVWDGVHTWVRLDGHPADVEAQRGLLSLESAPAPDTGRLPHRWSLPVDQLVTVARTWEPGSFLAEVGVGVAHRSTPAPQSRPSAEVAAIHQRLIDRFDPTRRLNSGRTWWPESP
jgi:FAD/FMN-containing dehydrogenase